MRKYDRNIEKLDYPKGTNSYDYFYWEYYDDNDYDDYDECHCCQSDCQQCYYTPENYDISNKIMINRLIKVRGLNREESWVESNVIDMNSIYSKDILRNKKILEILNQENTDDYTIENILKHKKNDLYTIR